MRTIFKIVAVIGGVLFLASCGTTYQQISENDVYLQKPSEIDFTESEDDLTSYNAHKAKNRGEFSDGRDVRYRNYYMASSSYMPFGIGMGMFQNRPIAFHGMGMFNDPFYGRSLYSGYGYGPGHFGYGMGMGYGGYNGYGYGYGGYYSPYYSGYGYGYGYGPYGYDPYYYGSGYYGGGYYGYGNGYYGYGNGYYGGSSTGTSGSSNVFHGPRQSLTSSSNRSSNYPTTTKMSEVSSHSIESVGVHRMVGSTAQKEISTGKEFRAVVPATINRGPINGNDNIRGVNQTTMNQGAMSRGNQGSTVTATQGTVSRSPSTARRTTSSFTPSNSVRTNSSSIKSNGMNADRRAVSGATSTSPRTNTNSRTIIQRNTTTPTRNYSNTNQRTNQSSGFNNTRTNTGSSGVSGGSSSRSSGASSGSRGRR